MAATLDLVLLTIILIPLSALMNYFAYGAKHPFVLMAEFFDSRDDSVSTDELWTFLMTDWFLYKYIIVQVLSFVFLLLYHVYFWSKFAATPGKMLLKCKIVDSEDAMRPIPIKRYVARFFSYIISALPLCIGFIISSFTKRRQTLHDLISKTVVIRFK